LAAAFDLPLIAKDDLRDVLLDALQGFPNQSCSPSDAACPSVH